MNTINNETKPQLSQFKVRRYGRIVLKYEVRRYTVFATKTAARGLKIGLLDVLRGMEDCFTPKHTNV